MQNFQRVNGWLLLTLMTIGLFQQNLLSGLIQLEQRSWLIFAVLALISLASVKEAWLHKWTWIIGVVYLVLAILSFTLPALLGYRLQPFEALLCLGLSTWAIFAALKTRPAVPTE
ncbi:MAG: hypothetical protein JWN30_1023 [Bacilli bacterium]|nr:hypothetical protein [Bacilli bacterium]